MEKGIKESKEAIIGLLVIGGVVAKELKDGFQVQDLIDVFSAINGDAERKAKVEAALAGVGEIPAEVKDLDWVEGIELLVGIAPEIRSLLESLSE